MSKKKKVIILSCMVAILALTAVLNFALTNDFVVQGESQTVSANYFTQYRNERLTTRNEELLQLDAIIASAEPGSQEYTKALATKLEITQINEKEFLLESLIKAYGFEDVVVVIGLDSDNINVIAKAEQLTTDDAIAIYTVIAEEQVASPENVKIISIS